MVGIAQSGSEGAGEPSLRSDVDSEALTCVVEVAQSDVLGGGCVGHVVAAGRRLGAWVQACLEVARGHWILLWIDATK